jgi:hypothetical protein
MAYGEADPSAERDVERRERVKAGTLALLFVTRDGASKAMEATWVPPPA